MIAITGPAANTIAATGVTLVGTCTSGVPITVSGTGVNQSTTAVCTNGAFSTPITFSSGTGTKAVTATQTDTFGLSGKANSTFISDAAPVVTITGPAANTVTSSTIALTGTCETGLSVVLSGGITSTTATCPSGQFAVTVTLTAPNGTKNVVASQTDSFGLSGSADQNFVLDVPPVIAITGPAQGTIASTGITLTGTCTSGIPIAVSGTGVNQSSTATCTSGAFSILITFSSGAGSKPVTVTQTDTFGGTASASSSFISDVAPVITITSPASQTIVQTNVTLSGACSSGTPITVSGAGVNQTSTATCTNGAYSAPITLSSGTGTKAITVTQTDSFGLTGSASTTLISDVAPAVTITAPAANTISGSTIALSGTCETGLTVNLSGGIASTTTTCPSGQFAVTVTLTAPNGTKNVVASQTDSYGLSGSANQNYILDTAPVIAITDPAANTIAATGVTLVGTCTSGVPITVSGTGVNQSTTAVCTNGAFSTPITFSSGTGTKAVTATQTDTFGLSGKANSTFISDAAPVVTITGPAANTVTSSTIALTGTCETGLSVVLSGGIASTTTTCPSGQFAVTVTLTAPNGTKNVVASQTDSYGLSGSANQNFVLDVPPAIAITGPAAGTVAQTGLTLTGTCANGLAITISGAGVSQPTSATCVNGTFSAPITFSSSNGNKTVTVSQTDSFGGNGSASSTFVGDIPPVVTISSPAAGTYTKGPLTLTGTCTSGILVRISGAVTPVPGVACSSGTYSAALSLTSPDGTKNVVVTQTDAYGGVGTANQNFNLLTIAPVVTITAPTNGSEILSTITLTGTCEANLPVTVSGSVVATATGSCTSGSYSIQATVTSGAGSKSITVSQTDAAGNVGSANAQYTLGSVVTDTFTSSQTGSAVDILFVDDNSASMDVNEGSLGSKFSSLTSALNGVDWQAGITTTDCGAGETTPDQWNICGSLLPLTGATGSILTAQTPNYLTVFDNTIVRPETVGCIERGSCPDGDSTPLLATMTAMQKYNTDDAGFFRSNAQLAVVILTNANENNDAPTSTSTTAQQVVNEFNSIWGNTSKILRVYSIIVLNGDSTCLAAQSATGISAYGTYPENLSTLTGGISVSICATDYSVTLNQIATNLLSVLPSSVTLSQTPTTPSDVQVVFTPAQSGITWTVNGNVVTFSQPIPAGTQITVTYIH